MTHSRWTILRDKQLPWALLALLLPALLYANTLAPSIVIGDSAEFQTEAWRLGVTHPTGYPLYLLLGRLFALFFPLGEAALRLNLFSMACALFALWLVFDILVILTHHPFMAAAGTWLAAAGPAFWSQAIIAEVYTLHALLLMATFNTMLRWRQTRQDRWFVLAGLTVGLGLAHHRTIVLLLPAVGIYVWLCKRPRPADGVRPAHRTLLHALIALVLPTVLYVYVPLRWPVVYHRWPRWSELVDFLLARGYSYAFQLSLLYDTARWRVVGELALRQLTWVGVGLAILGIVALARRHGHELVLFGLALIAFVVFGASYQVPDVAVFFIPAWLILALVAAMGANGLVDLIAPYIKRGRPDAPGLWDTAIAALLPAGITIWLIANNLTTLDRSGDLAAHAIAERALAHPPQENALIVCDFERLSALRYAFGVQAADLNVEATMPDTEEMAYHLIEQALAQGRPTYLARPLPGVAEQYRLTSHGPLVRVSREPEYTLPDSVLIQPRAVSFADQDGAIVALLGHDAPALAVRRGQTFAMTLYWQALFASGQLPLPYQVHLRLNASDGATVAGGQERHPVEGLYPINAWQPGQVVADYTLFHVSAEVPPGEYRLEAEWALPFSEVTLTAQAPHDQRYIASIQVLPAPDWKPAPQYRRYARFTNGLSLIGFDLQGRPVPGRRLQATLYWRATEPVDDVPVTLQLERADRETLYAISQVLAGWPEGETFPLSLNVAIPSDTRAANARLVVHVPASDTTRPSWWKKPVTELDLTSIALQVPPPAPASAAGTPLESSFDDLAMLLSYDMPEQVRPGETVRITLHWWAMSPIEQDYTVFVHLLDGEGRVKWQQDLMPVFGTRPTSSWQPGEMIEDVHDISLPADAADGTYRVEIGLYSPLTWQRLRVLDPDGIPQADHLFLDPIRVQQ